MTYRYNVEIRKAVPDYEIPSDEWQSEFYSEPYIIGEDAADAIQTAKDFMIECDGDPDDYDWRAEKLPTEWAAYLDGEECGAYDRVEADDVTEAAEDLAEEMEEKSPDASFKADGNRIYIYRDGEPDGWVEVHEVDYDD